MTASSLGALLGRTVATLVSEPWELVDTMGAGPFLADVSRIGVGDAGDGASILIKLKRPFRYESTDCEYFLASVRYEGDSLRELLEGKAVVCNLTAVPGSQATSADPFDMSSWRGGLGLVGTLELR